MKKPAKQATIRKAVSEIAKELGVSSDNIVLGNFSNIGQRIVEPTGHYVYKDGYITHNIALFKKPHWFHRFMINLCFGLDWVDNK